RMDSPMPYGAKRMICPRKTVAPGPTPHVFVGLPTRFACDEASSLEFILLTAQADQGLSTRGWENRTATVSTSERHGTSAVRTQNPGETRTTPLQLSLRLFAVG